MVPRWRRLPVGSVELDGGPQQLGKGSPIQRQVPGDLDGPLPVVVGLLEDAFRVLEQMAFIEVNVDPSLGHVPLHECAVALKVGVAPFDALFERSRQRMSFLQQHQTGVPLPAAGEPGYEHIDIHS